MTKIKTLVNEIFAKYNVELSAEEPKAEVKAELATATLKDGTVVQSDSETWEAGVNAYVVNEDGEKVAVPTGEYELEDGKILVVTEGVVDAIKEAAAEEVEEEVEASKEEATKEAKEVTPEATEKVEASEVVKADFSKEDVSEMLEKMATTLRAEFSDQLDKKDEEIKAKAEELEVLKENFEHKGLPKAPEAKAARPSQKEISKLSPKERVAQLHNLYK